MPETAWVIEHCGSDASRPEYFMGLNANGHPWSFDHLKAVRFARREDAEAIKQYIFGTVTHRIAEHQWE